MYDINKQNIQTVHYLLYAVVILFEQINLRWFIKRVLNKQMLYLHFRSQTKIE